MIIIGFDSWVAQAWWCSAFVQDASSARHPGEGSGDQDDEKTGINEELLFAVDL